ncbi:hypothetical protein LSAT2_017676 [Lamellibrachia satsuma]|nr:hypothetical protein LSAT2_017676 [Lamellibrachia satsuma]
MHSLWLPTSRNFTFSEANKKKPTRSAFQETNLRKHEDIICGVCVGNAAGCHQWRARIMGLRLHLQRRSLPGYENNEVFHGLLALTYPNGSCSYLQCSNELNALLLSNLTKDGRVYLMASYNKGDYFLRFAVCSKNTESSCIQYSWDVIHQVASGQLKDKARNGKQFP